MQPRPRSQLSKVPQSRMLKVASLVVQVFSLHAVCCRHSLQSPAGYPPVLRQCHTGNSPLEGREGRQARGDVPVGEHRHGSCRDIPPGTEGAPTPFKAGILPRNAATASPRRNGHTRSNFFLDSINEFESNADQFRSIRPRKYIDQVIEQGVFSLRGYILSMFLLEGGL